MSDFRVLRSDREVLEAKLRALTADLATVRAERDRMRPVVVEAVEWSKTRHRDMSGLMPLWQAAQAYLASEPTKETK